MTKLILLLLVISSCLLASDIPEKISLSKAIEDIKELCSAINEKYSYLEYKEFRYGFNWRNECSIYRKLIGELYEEEISTSELSFIISDLLGVFNDLHTRAPLYCKTYKSIGIRLYYAEGYYFILSAKQEVYKVLGLTVDEFERKKFVMLEINGVPIETVVKKFRAYFSANEKSFKSRAARAISGPCTFEILNFFKIFKSLDINISEKVTLKVKSLAEEKIYLVTYDWIEPDKSFRSVFSDSNIYNIREYTEDYVVDAKIIDENNNEIENCAEKYKYKFKFINSDIAYLRIPTWYIDDWDDAPCVIDFLLASVDKVNESNAGGLIIDVRGNGGGNSIWNEFTEKLMSGTRSVIGNVIKYHKPSFNGYFENENGVPNYIDTNYPEPIPIWFTSRCKSTDYTELSDEERFEINSFNEIYNFTYNGLFENDDYSKFHYCFLKPAQNRFTGKIAILIDRYGYSSNDQFVSSIKSISPERVKLFGERTQGGSGGGGKFKLPNSKISIRYCKFSNWSYNGYIMEDDGLIPDYEIDLKIDDIIHPERDDFLQAAIDYLN